VVLNNSCMMTEENGLDFARAPIYDLVVFLVGACKLFAIYEEKVRDKRFLVTNFVNTK
jgi:hypothetical protein